MKVGDRVKHAKLWNGLHGTIVEMTKSGKSAYVQWTMYGYGGPHKLENPTTGKC